MSVAAMADNKLTRDATAQLADDKPVETVELPEGGRVVGVRENALNAVVQWIPAETIGAYVFLLTLLDPLEPNRGQQIYQLDFSGRWFIFALGALLTVLSVPLACAVKARLASVDFQPPVRETVIALVAFILWAIALPDTPLNDWSWWDPQYGAAAIVVSAVLLHPLAILFRINGKWTKAVAVPKEEGRSEPS